MIEELLHSIALKKSNTDLKNLSTLIKKCLTSAIRNVFPIPIPVDSDFSIYIGNGHILFVISGYLCNTSEL